MLAAVLIVLQRCTEFLKSRAELLAEYFAVSIDEKGHLHSLPQLIPKYLPPLHRLPEFLFKLAVQVNWEEEIDCLHSISRVIAWFYSLCEDYELDDDKNSASVEQIVEPDTLKDKSEEEVVKELASGYSLQMLKFVTQHIFFPACKQEFYPPQSFLNGTIIETACLKQLYRTFERC